MYIAHIQRLAGAKGQDRACQAGARRRHFNEEGRGSWEYQFHRSGVDAALLEWRDPTRQALRDALSAPLLERAIGVIYRPQTELQSHYFPVVLAEQFDAYIWLDETRAVKPLSAPGTRSHDDETYPFGL